MHLFGLLFAFLLAYIPLQYLGLCQMHEERYIQGPSGNSLVGFYVGMYTCLVVSDSLRPHGL